MNVTININHKEDSSEHIFSLENYGYLNELNPIKIHELDEIALTLNLNDSFSESDITIFIEDYEVEILRDSSRYIIKANRYFQESFGQASIKIQIKDNFFLILFDVKWNKIKTLQIEEMIQLLYSYDASLIRLCLSKTKFFLNNTKGILADPETILSTAEKTLKIIDNHKNSFKNISHKKVIKEKEMPLNNEQNIYDPVDIIDNIDSLIICSQNEDLMINGKKFQIDKIPSINFKETQDTQINSVLLGGIYSIYRKTSMLKNELIGVHKKNNIKIYDDEYKEIISMDQIIAKVTKKNMLLRCDLINQKAKELILFFEKKLKFVYRGEIYPKFNPFVKHTRNYRSIFSELFLWYNLGKPDLSTLDFLIKLRSLSKLYEIFSYIIINKTILEDGWGLKILDNDFCFEKNNKKINIYYEKKIRPYNKVTKFYNNELIDISRRKSLHNDLWWYKPDFILELSQDKYSVYIILDAKYSSKSSVKEYHLKDIIDKYLLNIRVFNKNINKLDNDKILYICAVYPENMESNSKYYSYWNNKIDSNEIKMYPLAGMIPLSPKNENIFEIFLKSMIKDIFND
jgi:hypothetical protein